MITISDEAVQMIAKKGGTVYLEVPKQISNCCFGLSECPAVKLGKPEDISKFEIKKIKSVTLCLPKDFCEDDLEIRVSKFLGFSRLVLEGWKMI